MPISDEVRRAAAALIGRLAPGQDVKWVEEDNLHVTLSFLGATPEGRIPALVRRLERAARRPPFTVSFEDVESRSRVIWVRIGQGAAELSEVAAALPQLETRGFLPHLTLGRPRSKVKLQAPPLGQRQLAEKLVLYESKLSPKGPAYAALAEARFDPDPGQR